MRRRTSVKGVDLLLTQSDLAELLSLSRQTVVRTLLKRHVIRAARVGKTYYVRPVDFAAYLDSRRV